LVGSEKDVVLDCYRLARWYHCSPVTFLEMPLSEVRVHMEHTIELARIMRQNQETTDDDD
jgi:hypothetical protein